MNKSKAIKIAIAFKRGAAFIRGMRQLAQDADVPEGARWITIGAHENEDGESSGGRHVLIDKESGTILKGLSKDVQGKTLSEAFKELKKDQKAAEQKAAEQKAAEEKKAAEQKAAEQKAAEQKAAEQKAAEEKKAAEQKAAKNSHKADFNLPIRDFMQKTKFRPGTFAAEWMQKAPDGADTLDLLTENMPEDCQYLLKHTMEAVQFKPITGRLKPNESEAFYSHDRCVNFPLAFFRNGAPRSRYQTSYEIIMHELGHAVDHIAGVKGGGGWITVNATLKNAITHDTNQLIDEQREAVRKKLDASEREKDRLIAKYMLRNPDAKRPTPRGLVDFGVAEAIREWAQRSDEGWYGAMSGASDMISAVTLNKIKDGGIHKTSYWKSGEYNMNTEFMAHYFETCTSQDTKKTFAKIFPTATKVLEILIEDTAKGLRQKEKRK